MSKAQPNSSNATRASTGKAYGDLDANASQPNLLVVNNSAPKVTLNNDSDVASSDDALSHEKDEFDTFPSTYHAAYGTFDAAREISSTLKAATENHDSQTVSTISTRPSNSTLESLGQTHSSVTAQPTISITSAAEEEASIDSNSQGLIVHPETWIRDTIRELRDPSWSNPTAEDMHDRMMQQFYVSHYSDLPAEYPERHMHVLNRDAYIDSKDQVVAYAKPRLCDAIATVLWETGEECLDAFLDVGVTVFEWRRECELGMRAGKMIRREGNRVWVGIYYIQKSTYIWKPLIKCHIHFTGKWSEVYASSRGSTLSIASGPDMEEYNPQAPRNGTGEDNHDPKYALSMGRELAHRFLNNKGETDSWAEQMGVSVRWEADGIVTQGKLKTRPDKNVGGAEMNGGTGGRARSSSERGVLFGCRI